MSSPLWHPMEDSLLTQLCKHTVKSWKRLSLKRRSRLRITIEARFSIQSTPRKQLRPSSRKCWASVAASKKKIKVRTLTARVRVSQIWVILLMKSQRILLSINLLTDSKNWQRISATRRSCAERGTKPKLRKQSSAKQKSNTIRLVCSSTKTSMRTSNRRQRFLSVKKRLKRRKRGKKRKEWWPKVPKSAAKSTKCARRTSSWKMNLQVVFARFVPLAKMTFCATGSTACTGATSSTWSTLCTSRRRKESSRQLTNLNNDLVLLLDLLLRS